MVWNSETSTLYQAVERHNTQAHQPLPPKKNTPLQKEPERQYLKEPAPSSQHHDTLYALFNDRDSLLIAAVILILLHEKADMMLILALAFVLFS